MKFRLSEIAEAIEDLISEARNLCKDVEERILRMDKVEKTHLVKKYVDLLKKADDQFVDLISLKLDEFEVVGQRILDLDKEKKVLSLKIKSLNDKFLDGGDDRVFKKMDEVQKKIKVVSREKELLVKKVNSVAEVCIRSFEDFKFKVEKFEEVFFEECEKKVLKKNLKSLGKIKSKLGLTS